MKKYSRTELYDLCRNCNVKQICEELYDTLYTDSPYTPMRSGDKDTMNNLRDNRSKMISTGRKATIVIIHKDIPCLVMHRENDKNCKSISSIMIPFQSNDDNFFYKIHEVREILDALSYDDYTSRSCISHRPIYSAR